MNLCSLFSHDVETYYHTCIVLLHLIISNRNLFLEILDERDSYFCVLIASENVGYEGSLNLHLNLQEVR